MTLDPKLGRADRIASLLAGLAGLIYAAFGDFDQVWLRGGVAIAGLAFLAGGIGGT